MKRQFEAHILKCAKEGQVINGLENLFLTWVAENTKEIMALMEVEQKEVDQLRSANKDLSQKLNQLLAQSDANGDHYNDLRERVDFNLRKVASLEGQLERAQMNFAIATRAFHKSTGLDTSHIVGTADIDKVNALLITP